MSDNAAKLADILKQTAKAHVNAQIVWAKVKQVDWTKKEMTAVSLVDDLDYYNVSLGLQHYTRKPKKDSMVLLAVIENKPQHTILLFAEDVEEAILNDGAHGGLVISKEVADELNEIKSDLNSLKMVFQSWVTIPSDGGAALKTAATSWSSQQLTNIDKTDLENEKIKHG